MSEDKKHTVFRKLRKGILGLLLLCWGPNVSDVSDSPLIDLALQDGHQPFVEGREDDYLFIRMALCK
jgi:hypothetical protein